MRARWYNCELLSKYSFKPFWAPEYHNDNWTLNESSKSYQRVQALRHKCSLSKSSHFYLQFFVVGILVFGGDHYRNLSHIVDPIGYEIMHLVNYPVETSGSDFWGSCAGE